MHPASTRIGLGMIRIPPDEAASLALVREALAREVRDFDLGFLADPAALARARLLREATEASGVEPRGIRATLRGDLGQAGDARIFECAKALGAARLGYLVSDPEFALARMDGDHARLYAEIRADLAVLERLVAEGAIDSSGVGSAAFTYPKDDPEYLSVSALFEGTEGNPLAARERLGGFRRIEFPFNLYESSAAWLENQLLPDAALAARSGTLLETAKAFGLETLARRPLTAVTEAGVLRLVSYPDHHRVDLDEAVKRTLEIAMAEESKLLASGAALHWAHRLRRDLVQVRDPEQWKEIARRRIQPELENAFRALGPSSARYADAMEALLLSVRLWFEKAAAERNERFRARVVQVAPSLRGERDFARLATRIYRSIEGLNCVFIGMRSPAQIESILGSEPRPIASEEAMRALETAREEIREFLKGPTA